MEEEVLERIGRLGIELHNLGIEKFKKHEKKGDWRKSKTLNYAFSCFLHEVAELNEALNKLSDKNVKEELGDCYNYLIILMDLYRKERE